MEVHLLGEMKGAVGVAMPNISCRFRVVTNQDDEEHWMLNEGEVENYTQMCGNTPVVWNHPLDVSFFTTSVACWPQLYIEVWSQDEYGRNDIAGYGMIQVPSCPGEYADLDAVLWRPQGTLMERLRASFLGGYPQLIDPESSVCHDPSRFAFGGRVGEGGGGKRGGGGGGWFGGPIGEGEGGGFFRTETMGRVLVSLNVVVSLEPTKGILLSRTPSRGVMK